MKNQNKKDTNAQSEKMNKIRNNCSTIEAGKKSDTAQNCRNSQSK